LNVKGNPVLLGNIIRKPVSLYPIKSSQMQQLFIPVLIQQHVSD